MLFDTSSIGGDESITIGSKRSRSSDSMHKDNRNAVRPKNNSDTTSSENEDISSLGSIGGDESITAGSVSNSIFLVNELPDDSDDELTSSSLGTAQTKNVSKYVASSNNSSSTTVTRPGDQFSTPPATQEKINTVENSSSKSGALKS